MWQPPAQRLRVGWLGPNCDGLGWLHHRVCRFSSPPIASIEITTDTLVPIRRKSIEGFLEAGVDRLILACETRLDYPIDELLWLQAAYPEVPCGLAMGSYWEGARRTGLGSLAHVAWPWHRWWDGWVDWLDAANPELFGPCLHPLAYYHPRPLPSGSSAGWILADCQQTAVAWCLAAEQAGACARHSSWQNFETHLAAAAEVDWILWDDSCLTTCCGPDSAGDMNCIEHIAQHCSSARLACALTMPRWDNWQQLARLGAQELLSKPNMGRGLHRMLNSLPGRTAMT